jgi:hypothetical protein
MTFVIALSNLCHFSKPLLEILDNVEVLHNFDKCTTIAPPHLDIHLQSSPFFYLWQWILGKARVASAISAIFKLDGSQKAREVIA